jgi:hypothetical protein
MSAVLEHDGYSDGEDGAYEETEVRTAIPNL